MAGSEEDAPPSMRRFVSMHAEQLRNSRLGIAFQGVQSVDPCYCHHSSAVGVECISSAESDRSSAKRVGKAVHFGRGCVLRILQRSLLLIGLLVLAVVSLSTSHERDVVVKSWAPVFFYFECQNIKVDSQSEVLTEQQQWCCRHAKVGCPKLEFDCKIGPDSSPEWWSGEQRSWCCEHKQAGCPTHSYDCTQSSVAMSEWPQRQKDWCCEHSHVGCPEYNCQGNSVASWSKEQKDWCCFHSGVGCASTDTGVGDSVSVSDGVSEGGGQLGAETDSDDGSSEAYEPPDVSGPTHDCQDGLWDWQQSWPDTKKRWCCANKLLFCPSKWTDTGGGMAPSSSSSSGIMLNGPQTTASAKSHAEQAFLIQDLQVQGLALQEADAHRTAIKQAIAETLGIDDGSVQIISLKEAVHRPRRLPEGSVTSDPTLSRRLPGPSFSGLRGEHVVKLTYKVSADAESAEIVLVKMAKITHDPSSLEAKLVHFVGKPNVRVMADAPHSMSEASPTRPVVGTSSVGSTTAITHNCQSNDQYTSLQSWSAEKRSWCCWHHHVGCLAMTTNLPKGPHGGSASANSTHEKPEVRDCHALEPSNWSDGKLQWCCKYFKWDCDHPSLFDCDAGLASWQMEWSAVKKVWCCKHRQKGCEIMTTTLEQYNCKVDHLRLDTEWASEKRSWCCWHHGVGCVTTPAQTVPSTHGATSSKGSSTHSVPAQTAMSTMTISRTRTLTTTGNTSTTTSTVTKPVLAVASTTVAVMVSSETPPSTTPQVDVTDSNIDGILGEHTYNCVLDLSHWQTSWDEPKRRWCCDHFHWGCDSSSSDRAVAATAATSKTSTAALSTTPVDVSSTEYDCWAGVSNYKVVWSPAKRRWCCHKEHLACDNASTKNVAAHNCSEGRATCITGWSLAKKSWCLRVGQQGCLLTTAPPFILPQAKAEMFQRGSAVARPPSINRLALKCLLLCLISLVGFVALCRVRRTTQLSSGVHSDYAFGTLRQGILFTESEYANDPGCVELVNTSILSDMSHSAA